MVSMFNKTSAELTKKERIVYNLIVTGIIVWVSVTIFAMVTVTLGIRF